MESTGISPAAPNIPDTGIGAPPSYPELDMLMARARRERSLVLAALIGKAFAGIAGLAKRLRPEHLWHKASHSSV